MENNLIVKALHIIIEMLLKIHRRLKISTGGDDLISAPPPRTDEKLMSRQELKDYLGISESTYIRKVKNGELKPLKMPGGDRFYKSELIEAYIESIRRGRI